MTEQQVLARAQVSMQGDTGAVLKIAMCSEDVGVSLIVTDCIW